MFLSVWQWSAAISPWLNSRIQRGHSRERHILTEPFTRFPLKAKVAQSLESAMCLLLALLLKPKSMRTDHEETGEGLVFILGNKESQKWEET